MTDINYPPQSGLVGQRVRLWHNTLLERTLIGEVVRDDIEYPWEFIARLDDGRYVTGEECQWEVTFDPARDVTGGG